MSQPTAPSYGPPAPGFQQAGPSPQPQIGTSPVPIMVGPQSMGMKCPHCHATITTTVENEANTKTHLFALGLCLIGCWPCCLIPYCMDSCQNRRHLCPGCKAYLGTYSS